MNQRAQLHQQHHEPIDVSVTHLPTGSLVVRLTGTIPLRCVFGEPHDVQFALTRTITSRARDETLDLAERTIRYQPGAITTLGWHLVHEHLANEWVDPCLDSSDEIVDGDG